MPKSVIQYDLLISCPGDLVILKMRLIALKKSLINSMQLLQIHLESQLELSIGVKTHILNLVVNHKHFLMNNL